MIHNFRLTIYEHIVAVTVPRKSEIKNRKSLVSKFLHSSATK